jgi:hypothetical protein
MNSPNPSAGEQKIIIIGAKCPAHKLLGTIGVKLIDK